MSIPFELRWGVISTGKIAAAFVKDLLIDPKSSRDVHDIAHRIHAVASRSVPKAQEFIDALAPNRDVIAYGSYDEVIADKNVDVIYIGTPHSYHYSTALAALNAKKNVLCEKPITLNAAELRSLIAAAKENDVFFMEAMWTRFHPLAKEVKALVDGGELGLPVVVHADLSRDFDLSNIPTSHQILDPALGGGALLDFGPYVLLWAIIALYEHPSNNNTKPSSISSSMLKNTPTGVDSNTAFTLTFASPSSQLTAQAVLTCSIDLASSTAPSSSCKSHTGLTIRFTKGTIHVAGPLYCPLSYTVQYFDKPGSGVITKEERKEFDFKGHAGLYWEADEVARCVRDGRKESEVWGWDKSLLEMEVFDEVRRQGGYVFPPGVEQVV